jgi:hypothetical protein
VVLLFLHYSGAWKDAPMEDVPDIVNILGGRFVLAIKIKKRIRKF